MNGSSGLLGGLNVLGIATCENIPDNDLQLAMTASAWWAMSSRLVIHHPSLQVADNNTMRSSLGPLHTRTQMLCARHLPWLCKPKLLLRKRGVALSFAVAGPRQRHNLRERLRC